MAGDGVSLTWEASTAVVHVSGDVDLDTAVALWAVLEKAVSASPAVVVDLSAADLVDSTGVGALVRGRNAARNRSGELVLAGVSSFLRTVLETMRLTAEFPSYRTVAEAVAALR
jgi:anti-sigma B factor antagonist